LLAGNAVAAPTDGLASAREALRAGRYEQATKLAARVDKSHRAEADAVAGEALRRSGKLAAARALLEQTVADLPSPLAARLELGRVYRLMGEPRLASQIWNRFYDDFEAGKIDKKSPRELVFVAEAARYLEGWKDANDTFRDAVEADPKSVEAARANIEWGRLFLEKYDAGHAEQCLQDALKVLPDDPDLHALIGRVKLEQSFDVDGIEKEIAAALKVNPHHAEALALRAEVDLFLGDRAGAMQAVSEIRKVDPFDVPARGIALAVAILDEKPERIKAEMPDDKTPALAASEVLVFASEMLVREHRYETADGLLAEAVKRRPKDWIAQAAYGANLLRRNEEEKGLAALRAAWKGDKFNVRTYNLLNLFEQVIPKAYSTVEVKPFRLRVPTKEQKIIERYIQPMLASEFAEFQKRYGFTPAGPLVMELFVDPQHYAVRTIGLPHLEALGVTFDRLVTAMSPSLGRFNWGMALWHEVGHVFSVQLSKSKVPRWFTEGLSEWETARARPEWRRHTYAELGSALAQNKLFPVDKLDQAFARSRNISQMVIAYHQSAEAVTFLAKRWGFPAVRQALVLFADGKSTSQTIRAVTGLDVAKFDAEFRADLKARLAVYEGKFSVSPSEIGDPDELRERVKKHPEDLRAAGYLALLLIKARAGEEAQALIDLVDQKKDIPIAKKREIVLAAGLLATSRKDWRMAKLFFEGLIANGGDGHDARLGLGVTLAGQSDFVGAEAEFKRALAMDPDRADSAFELYKIYDKMKNTDGALAALEQAARLDCMDASVPPLLLEKLAAAKRWQKLVEVAPLALYTVPFSAKVHLRIAEAFIETGKTADARRELDAVGECEPTDEEKAAAAKLGERVGRI
jgi:tetratricopeptide (TPR) repeat protein